MHSLGHLHNKNGLQDTENSLLLSAFTIEMNGARNLDASKEFFVIIRFSWYECVNGERR